MHKCTMYVICGLLYKISKHHFLFLKVFGVQSVSNKVPDLLPSKEIIPSTE